jgi:hypothetical protein
VLFVVLSSISEGTGIVGLPLVQAHDAEGLHHSAKQELKSQYRRLLANRPDERTHVLRRELAPISGTKLDAWQH